MSKVKIEMIHDLVCSWCAIGYQYLSDAADELDLQLDISYLPHQLNPNMGTEGMDIRDYFKSAHGWSDKKNDHYRNDLLSKAKDAGVNIDFRSRTRYFNTYAAHRLLAEADSQNIARSLHNIILSAYHANGLNISDPNVLTELAARAGMSKSATAKALDLKYPLESYSKAVQRRAQFVTPSVPAWVFNGSELLIGSNSKTFFKTHLINLNNLQNKSRENYALH